MTERLWHAEPEIDDSLWIVNESLLASNVAKGWIAAVEQALKQARVASGARPETSWPADFRGEVPL